MTKMANVNNLRTIENRAKKIIVNKYDIYKCFLNNSSQIEEKFNFEVLAEYGYRYWVGDDEEDIQ